MSRLADIPIRLEPYARNGGLGGGVTALINELMGLLEGLARGADDSTIDVRSLPMSGEDRAALQEILGNGEVQATVRTAGISTVRETQVSGVWWIEHRDPQGELIAELIEVSALPQFLAAGAEEIAASAPVLRARLATAAAAALPAQ